ncbi:uncharacterized protein N7529_000195 [Penicillium soppii]|jgi:hypothetical protein|uniref:uncharacterized protein n=1 Tax=Penicillium soppii TaxID=69789 RepID=UPI002549037D|nr:uncharacterized protein N7529_000195 [Penicillium soppii]KAJ5881523.1 hypothetical protein N7529_000195 [Penicillium soppii]
MQLTIPLMLAGLATALPSAAKVNTISPEVIWSVSNFTIGCSQGGCIFEYDIAGRANSETPPFSTHCSGAEKKRVYCDDKNITTTVSPAGNPLWTVDVTHRWNTWLDPTSLATWYQSGAKNVTVPDHNPIKFVMQPTEEYGVA